MKQRGLREIAGDMHLMSKKRGEKNELLLDSKGGLQTMAAIGTCMRERDLFVVAAFFHQLGGKQEIWAVSGLLCVEYSPEQIISSE